MKLNPEKQKIIETKGSILVTANPGTGKTLLLAHKFLDLVQNDVKPENILCLTFTEKAKAEMEKNILKLLVKNNIKVDFSKLNISTFHSYALDNIEGDNIISPNLLRYSIFKYMKDNEMLNYGDEYLIEVIVPKMENLIRYLKSFGITPDKIEIKEAKKFLEGDKKITKEEIDKFADDFVDIFKYYESIKERKGYDYADLLLEFLKLKHKPKYEFVLVDELQDVNKMEADIALMSGKTFFAVGDKKQAIFGFQGGSILNFKAFEKFSSFVLSENFRSTDQILEYAKEYFISATKEEVHKKELRDLKSSTRKKGDKPIIYEIEKNKGYIAACKLAQEHKGKVAIIARTNYQLMELARELNQRNIEYCSTFFSASTDAKNQIINFLKGMLSKDIREVKNAMFTPFFPVCLEDAFSIVDDGKTIEDVYKKCPEFAKLRKSLTNVEEVNSLFKEKILPVAMAYGKEYLYAAVKLHNSYQEALKVLEGKSISNLMAYLQSTDLLADESDAEHKLVLTTIHKAKGREFETVIYLPSRTTDRSNFQDRVVEAILESKGVNAEEELEEETLRVNFVAFTRAMDKLIIITDKPTDYLNNYSQMGNLDVDETYGFDLTESKKWAYNFFINGEFERAKELLQTKKAWIRNYVKNYFDSMEKFSFTTLKDNAYQFFVDNIIGLKPYSAAMDLGTNVHAIAQRLVKGEKFEVGDELKQFKINIEKLLKEIKEKYPESVYTEEKFIKPISEFIKKDEEMFFTGKIDAIFRNGNEYLVIDWKTDKKTDHASKHRQQLEAYKKAFSLKHNIPLSNIKVAIGYIGLRPTINTGKINAELDMAQPAKSAFETFTKKVNQLLEWGKDVDKFFEDFKAEEVDDCLWRGVVEEYEKG